MVILPRMLAVLLAYLLALISPLICKAQQIPTSTYQEMRWRMIGPFRGGRARAAGWSARAAQRFLRRPGERRRVEVR